MTTTTDVSMERRPGVVTRLLTKALRPVLLPIIKEAMADDKDQERPSDMHTAVLDALSQHVGRAMVARQYKPGSGIEARY